MLSLKAKGKSQEERADTERQLCVGTSKELHVGDFP